MLISLHLGEHETYRQTRQATKTSEPLPFGTVSFRSLNSDKTEIPINETRQYKILPMHPQVGLKSSSYRLQNVFIHQRDEIFMEKFSAAI
jgi:hypothetical protein